MIGSFFMYSLDTRSIVVPGSIPHFITSGTMAMVMSCHMQLWWVWTRTDTVQLLYWSWLIQQHVLVLMVCGDCYYHDIDGNVLEKHVTHIQFILFVNRICHCCAAYHIISYHIISYHIISYHIISYHIIYHITSHHIISYHMYLWNIGILMSWEIHGGSLYS